MREEFWNSHMALGDLLCWCAICTKSRFNAHEEFVQSFMFGLSHNSSQLSIEFNLFWHLFQRFHSRQAFARFIESLGSESSKVDLAYSPWISNVNIEIQLALTKIKKLWKIQYIFRYLTNVQKIDKYQKNLQL
jgi:hypothetical protein